LDELLLEIIGNVVLLAEEDDASLRDLGALLARRLLEQKVTKTIARSYL
jgi:hypothetical protein